MLVAIQPTTAQPTKVTKYSSTTKLNEHVLVWLDFSFEAKGRQFFAVMTLIYSDARV